MEAPRLDTEDGTGLVFFLPQKPQHIVALLLSWRETNVACPALFILANIRNHDSASGERIEMQDFVPQVPHAWKRVSSMKN